MHLRYTVVKPSQDYAEHAYLHIMNSRKMIFLLIQSAFT